MMASAMEPTDQPQQSAHGEENQLLSNVNAGGNINAGNQVGGDLIGRDQININVQDPQQAAKLARSLRWSWPQPLPRPLKRIPPRVKVGTGAAIATIAVLANLSQCSGFNLKDILPSINRDFSPARPTEPKYQGDNPHGETKPNDSVPSDLNRPGHSNKRTSDTYICNRVLALVAKAASGDWASEAQTMIDIEELAKTYPHSFNQSILDQASNKFNQGVGSRPNALALIKKAFSCTG